MNILNIVFIIFCIITGPLLFANEEIAFFETPFQHPAFDDAEKRLSIREYLDDELLFVSPSSSDGTLKNDIVGIPLVRGSDESALHNFEAQIHKMKKEGTLEKLENSVFTVVGVGKKEKNSIKKSYQNILDKSGLKKYRLKVISVPKSKVAGLSLKTFNYFKERFLHWFPSLERHYTTPEKKEVISGLITGTLLETGTIIYLSNSIENPINLSVTLTIHIAIFTALNVYNKFLLNWFRDPGTGRIGAFLKQLAITMPFVLNHSLGPDATAIVDFLVSNDLSVITQNLAHQTVNFVSEKWLTTVLAASLFTIVVVDTIGGWENRQVGVERGEKARSFTKWARIPILYLNALALAMASGVDSGNTLVELGPLSLNKGQAFILSLIGGGYITYKYGLNMIFEAYLSPRKFIKKVSGFKFNNFWRRLIGKSPQTYQCSSYL